ncbi:hypothetical protein LTR66_015477 [Elasticomyces elasticus]|nr:hypothetical protein LTR66_015477 [Elasticomyces elasticus]
MHPAYVIAAFAAIANAMTPNQIARAIAADLPAARPDNIAGNAPLAVAVKAKRTMTPNQIADDLSLELPAAKEQEHGKGKRDIGDNVVPFHCNTPDDR